MMRNLLAVLGAGSLALAAPYEPQSFKLDARDFDVEGFNLTDHMLLHARQEECGDAPVEYPRAICGAMFPDMDQKGWVPALAAAPIFNFGRQSKPYSPCYPESARLLHTVDGPDPKPNTGTDPNHGLNPGRNCNSPGPYSGEFSAGNSFPVYVDWVWCPGHDDEPETWRINYNLYYPHDATHKHDWEMVSVIWRKQTEDDWWVRDSVAFTQHSHTYRDKWETLLTVNRDDDQSKREKDDGLKRDFPKVYVGMWKNGNFPDRKTSCFGQPCSAGNEEYRSDDWIRQPRVEDFKVASMPDKGVIPASWGEEGGMFKGLSTPNKRVDDACKWKYGKN